MKIEDAVGSLNLHSNSNIIGTCLYHAATAAHVQRNLLTLGAGAGARLKWGKISLFSLGQSLAWRILFPLIFRFFSRGFEKIAILTQSMNVLRTPAPSPFTIGNNKIAKTRQIMLTVLI